MLWLVQHLNTQANHGGDKKNHIRKEGEELSMRRKSAGVRTAVDQSLVQYTATTTISPSVETVELTQHNEPKHDTSWRTTHLWNRVAKKKLATGDTIYGHIPFNVCLHPRIRGSRLGQAATCRQVAPMSDAPPPRGARQESKFRWLGLELGHSRSFYIEFVNTFWLAGYFYDSRPHLSCSTEIAHAPSAESGDFNLQNIYKKTGWSSAQQNHTFKHNVSFKLLRLHWNLRL
jgi:hypothetical protein